MRRLGHLLLGVLVVASAACRLDPYQAGQSGHWERHDAGHYGDGGGGEPDGEADACVPSGSEEICDGRDNDCNGEIDEGYDLSSDPYNCGACGTVCEYAFAFATCDASVCRMGDCLAGHHDANGDPGDGCEYACHTTNNGVEVCDGADNDCDDQIDEDFDLSSDPDHCGQCNRVCAFFQGTGTCVAGQCELDGCNGGFVDKDGDPNNGCECMLDLDEGTVPCQPGSPGDCGPGEVCADVTGDGSSFCASVPLDGCDGLDNDCDAVVDEDASALLGSAECYPHPVGCTEDATGVWSCIGECRTGVPSCVGGNVLCGGQVAPAIELCDGLDNDCDGVVDDGFDLENDPANCGACGLQCAPQVPNAVPGCAAGQCVVLACLLGYWDLNGDPADGCEYACSLTQGGLEVCGDGLDNDCNGQVDDGFDLANDVNNCGACGYACSAHRPFGTEVSGCVAGACQLACLPDFYDLDADLALGEAGTGCEYGCVVTNGGVEACDDADNDCDGDVDEDYFKDTNPDHCGSCGYRCADHTGANSAPAGCAAGVCQYACLPGFHDTDGDVGLGSGGTGCEYGCVVSNGGTEACDGVDNDCDGQTDEDGLGLPLTRACYTGPGGTEGVGSCSGGTETCSGGGWGLCIGELTPQSEVCDGLDNDCDTGVDEDFDLGTDLNNCGACDNSCWASPPANSYPDGCVTGVCTYACYQGFGDADGDLGSPGGTGCEYVCPVDPPSAEYCDGLDNDCDGQIDEGLTPPVGICYQGIDGPGPGTPGTDTNNPCRGTAAVCTDPDGAGGLPHGWYCDYPAVVDTDPGNPNAILGVESSCDGTDNDCDGVPDDEFNVGQVCYTGLGACRRPGNLVCTADGTSFECNAVAGAPGVEICDGIDNDCDGEVDEADPTDPDFDQYGDFVYVANGDFTIFAFEASRPSADATDGGFGDDGVPCSSAGVMPWGNLTAYDASPFGEPVVRDVCQRLGPGWDLCTDEQWYRACADGALPSGGEDFPYGPTFEPLLCNGFDYGVSQGSVQPRPSGSLAQCVRTFGAGEIFDLSGNLREWVLTGTGFELRGGAYNNVSEGGSAPEMQCNGVSTVQPDSEVHLPSIGFRCCYAGDLFN